MKIVQFFEKIPGGTTGTVWRAKDEFQREVAVKFFTTSIAGIREQVVQHAAALAAINHKNVISIFGIEDLVRPDAAPDSIAEPALVMEFAPGQTLKDWLSRTDIRRTEVIAVVEGMLSGLAAFHEKKMSHGDLHAGNIHVHSGVVKIIDPIAHDPKSALSTAAFREGQRRDSHFMKGLLIDVLRTGQSATEPFGIFCLLNSGEVSIPQLLEHANIALTSTITQEKVNQYGLSFYRVSRLAQAASSHVDWQELKKTSLRTLQPQIDRWGEIYSKIPRDRMIADQAIANCWEHLNSFLSFVLACAEEGSGQYRRDMLILQDLLRINWPRSGETTYVSLPEGLFYCGHYYCGAAACENGNFEAAFRLCRRKVAARGEEAEPLFSNAGLAGWPDLFEHNCATAFSFLLKSFGIVSPLREVFPLERTYVSSLVAYNLLLCVTEFVSLEPQQFAEKVGQASSPYRPCIPPVFALAPEYAVKDAWSMLFEDGRIQDRLLFENARMSLDELRRLWPTWMTGRYRLLSESGRPFLAADAPKEIFLPPD